MRYAAPASSAIGFVIGCAARTAHGLRPHHASAPIDIGSSSVSHWMIASGDIPKNRLLMPLQNVPKLFTTAQLSVGIGGGSRLFSVGIGGRCR